MVGAMLTLGFPIFGFAVSAAIWVLVRDVEALH